jgi:hypothetical protein
MVLVPDPDPPEKLTWDPKVIGIALDGLDPMTDKKKILCRILHYSIQMQMREVGTEYWIKIWSFAKSHNGDSEELITHRFQALKRDRIFGSQGLSRNLAESYRLGSGLEKSKTSESGNATGSFQVLEGSISNRPESPSVNRPVDWSQFRDETNPVQSSAVNGSSSSSEKLNLRTPPAPPVSTASGVKRTAPSDGGRGKLQANSQSPLRATRPTQRQIHKGSVEYSLGASRNNGGK